MSKKEKVHEFNDIPSAIQHLKKIEAKFPKLKKSFHEFVEIYMNATNNFVMTFLEILEDYESGEIEDYEELEEALEGMDLLGRKISEGELAAFINKLQLDDFAPMVLKISKEGEEPKWIH